MRFNSVIELKDAIANLQHEVACGKVISNEEVAKWLLVDVMIRCIACGAKNNSWNDQYFMSNVGALSGNDVIDKTISLIKLIKSEGLNNNNERSDFPLRNPKHVFDKIDLSFIDPVLPAINSIFM